MCMRRNPLHGALFLGIGLILVARGMAWAWILVVIGAVKLARWLGEPTRLLDRRILDDARAHGLRVPGDFVIREQLLKLYAKFTRAEAAYPQMATEYRGIVEACWRELALATTVVEWRKILTRALSEWPQPDLDEQPLEESLRRARQAARRWREARTEAFRSATP